MKITFFLGRVHHAIKLLPVVVGLDERRHDVSILVADNSINIDPATEYLHTYGINEFFHSKDFLTSDLVEQSREETLATISSAGPDAFLPYTSPVWISRSIRDAIYEYHAFNSFLNEHQPHVVFGLHENNFWVKLLFYLAKRKSIRTCSLMEGIILEREEQDLGKYSIGTDYTDTLFSWSEHDKQYYNDPHKIIPVGPSHLDEWIRITARPNYGEIVLNLKIRFGMPLDKPVVLFAPPRLDLYRGDPINAIRKLRDFCQFNNLHFVVKAHPFQGAIPSNLGVQVFNDDDAAPFILVSDIVVTQTSTIALEAIALKKPVVELDLDYYGIEQPLWKNGAATLVENNLMKIKDVVYTPIEDRNFDFLSERLPLADGQSVKRICDNIEGSFWIK